MATGALVERRLTAAELEICTVDPAGAIRSGAPAARIETGAALFEKPL